MITKTPHAQVSRGAAQVVRSRSSSHYWANRPERPTSTKGSNTAPELQERTPLLPPAVHGQTPVSSISHGPTTAPVLITRYPLAVTLAQRPKLLPYPVHVPAVVPSGGDQFRLDRSGGDVPLYRPTRDTQGTGKLAGGDKARFGHPFTLSGGCRRMAALVAFGYGCPWFIRTAKGEPGAMTSPTGRALDQLEDWPVIDHSTHTDTAPAATEPPETATDKINGTVGSNDTRRAEVIANLETVLADLHRVTQLVEEMVSR